MKNKKQMTRVVLRALCCSSVLLLAGGATADENRHDYLLFLNASGTHRSSEMAANTHPRDAKELGLAFIYTAETEKYRFLTELHAADKGEQEVARLQLGWRIIPRASLWIGRFHNPQGYWNTQYHHGVYLQTTVSHPVVEELDDHGGILPSHFVGTQLDGVFPAGEESTLRYELVFGKTGTLDEKGIESPDIIGPDRRGKAMAALRLTYNPTDGETDAAGIFLGRNRLPATDLSVQEVHQTVSGFFGNWETGKVRFFGTVFFFANDVEEAGSVSTGRFVAGYLQAEYRVNTPWTLYARSEHSRGTQGDPYLMLFPDFAERQIVAGARWDFARKQALKFEYGRPRIMGEVSRRLAAEWSMVLP